MPYINKNPIGLSKNEILSVIAFLQQMSGEPISVNPSELEVPGQRPRRRSRPRMPGRSLWRRLDSVGEVRRNIWGVLDQADYSYGRHLSHFEVHRPNIPGSAPLPSSLIFLYLMLTTVGDRDFCTLSGESKDAFWGPIHDSLTGENIGALQSARYLVLILFPLLVGWQTYGSTAVSDAPPAENRTIHPAPPGEYTGLVESRSKDAGEHHAGKGFVCRVLFSLPRRKFRRQGLGCQRIQPSAGQFFRSDDDRHASGKLSLLAHQEGWRRASRSKACRGNRPCRGGKFELPDEWIWKIIMGEYDGAGQKPRTWDVVRMNFSDQDC